MKRILFTLAALSFVFASFAQGLGTQKALKFDATNAHINLGNLPLDTANFTVEMWIKMNRFPAGGTTDDPCLLANKNWDSGNNTGLSIFFRDPGVLRLNIKEPNSTRLDANLNTALPFALGNWYHVAISINRRDSAITYVNGIKAGATFIGNRFGSINTTFPWRVNQDGRGNYGPNNNNRIEIDEFRLWSGIRTAAQIQEFVCSRPAANTPELIRNHSFNTVRTDSATNINDGFASRLVSVTNATYVNSGAFVADSVVQVTARNFTNTDSLTMNIANLGNVVVKPTQSGFGSMYIIQSNGLAFGSSSIVGADSSGNHFAVFTPNINNVNVRLDVNGYARAQAIATRLNLNQKASLDAITFAQVSNSNLGNGILGYTGSSNKVFALGGFNTTCAAPTGLVLERTTPTAATIRWNNSFLPINIQYGSQGFSLGTGSIIRNIVGTNYTLSNLLPNTSYQVYIQDSCVGLGTSTWVGPLSLTTVNPAILNTGAGFMANFSANAANTNHFNIGRLSELDNAQEFTIEFWAHPDSIQPGSDAALFSNKDWSSGNNTGLTFFYEGDNSTYYRFNYKAANGTRRDLTISPAGYDVKKKWSHVAVTFNRNGFAVAYLNGVVVDSINLQGTLGTLAGAFPYKLGQDGTGNYRFLNQSFKYLGKLDEFRIWLNRRTPEQIKTTMCRRLTGAEVGLYVYYNFNQEAFDTLRGFIAGTDAIGVRTVANNFTVSTAPVGDTSAYSYTINTFPTYLDLGTQMLRVTRTETNSGIIQVYGNKSLPVNTIGANLFPNSNVHFGVFTNDGNEPYKVSLNVSGTPQAVLRIRDTKLLQRANAASQWSVSNATPSVIELSLMNDSVYGSNEFLLSDSSINNCRPLALNFARSLSQTSAQIGWTPSLGNTITYEYGRLGFQLGTGTRVNVNNSTSGVANITGLVNGQLYQVYIRKNCGSTEQSAWSGPYVFYSAICNLPANITITDTTSQGATVRWNGNRGERIQLEWGPVGFITGQGILEELTDTTSFTFRGLPSNSTFAFVIRKVCGTNFNSSYSPQFTFRTLDPTSVNDKVQLNFALFPNPAQEQVQIQLSSSEVATIELLTFQGKVISRTNSDGGSSLLTFNLPKVPTGTYMVKITQAGKIGVAPLTVK
jgi:hypothetical protein